MFWGNIVFCFDACRDDCLLYFILIYLQGYFAYFYFEMHFSVFFSNQAVTDMMYKPNILSI